MLEWIFTFFMILCAVLNFVYLVEYAHRENGGMVIFHAIGLTMSVYATILWCPLWN